MKIQSLPKFAALAALLLAGRNVQAATAAPTLPLERYLAATPGLSQSFLDASRALTAYLQVPPTTPSAGGEQRTRTILSLLEGDAPSALALGALAQPQHIEGLASVYDAQVIAELRSSARSFRELAAKEPALQRLLARAQHLNLAAIPENLSEDVARWRAVFDQAGERAGMERAADVVLAAGDGSRRDPLPEGSALRPAKPAHGAEPRLRNRLIDPATGASHHGKVKTWSLGLVLSVLTQRSFSKRGRIGEFGELIGFITGHEIEILDVDEKGDKSYKQGELQDALYKRQEAADLILMQYPELAGVNPPSFASKEEVFSWVAAQEAKFGAELPLVQIKGPGKA